MWALFFNCSLKNMFHGVHIFQQSIKKYVPMGSNLFTEGPYISTLCLKNQFRGSIFFSKISSRGFIFGGSIFYVTGPSISPPSTALLDTGIQPPTGSCWTQTQTIQVSFHQAGGWELGTYTHTQWSQAQPWMHDCCNQLPNSFTYMGMMRLSTQTTY